MPKGGAALLAAGTSLQYQQQELGGLTDSTNAGDAGSGGSGGGLLTSPLYWVGVGFMGVDAVCSSILEVVVGKVPHTTLLGFSTVLRTRSHYDSSL